MTTPGFRGPGQTLPSPSLGPPKLSVSPSPPPFCGIPLDPEPPEPAEPEPAEPEPADPEPDGLWWWCLWCLGAGLSGAWLGAAGTDDAAGVADAAGAAAGAWLAGGWAALGPAPQPPPGPLLRRQEGKAIAWRSSDYSRSDQCRRRLARSRARHGSTRHGTVPRHGRPGGPGYPRARTARDAQPGSCAAGPAGAGSRSRPGDSPPAASWCVSRSIMATRPGC